MNGQQKEGLIEKDERKTKSALRLGALQFMRWRGVDTEKHSTGILQA